MFQTYDSHSDPAAHGPRLAALRAELGAVLERYRRRGAGTPGARRVSAVVALTPLPR
mgnify:CR=1 FL=1